MKRMMIAAAAVLLPTAASATSSIALSRDGSTATVSYDDLDLGSPQGRSELSARIRRAADMICFESAMDPLIIVPERAECHRAAVRNGVVQMNAIAGKAG